MGNITEQSHTPFNINIMALEHSTLLTIMSYYYENILLNFMPQ